MHPLVSPTVLPQQSEGLGGSQHGQPSSPGQGSDHSDYDSDNDDISDDGREDIPTTGMATLLSAPIMAGRLPRGHEHAHLDHDQWMIFPSLSDLSISSAYEVKDKIVLLESKDSMSLFDHVASGDLNQLSARQSRAHHFDVPDKGSKYVLDFTVSVIYQGMFTKNGYHPGRIAVSLFRLTGTGEESENTNESMYTQSTVMPQPVGYAPYNLQCPNLPNAIGRLVIFHKPAVRPLLPGRFRIVVGAASETRYSISVTCRYAHLALPVVDEEITQAKLKQAKVGICLKQIRNLEETLRLGDRKVEVCRKLVYEAEAESQRCRVASAVVMQDLKLDDVTMVMGDKERNDKEIELRTIDVEAAEWMELFITRSREFEDIEQGLAVLKQLLFDKKEEKGTLVLALDRARQELPACIALLRTMTEATAVAAQLNAPIPVNADDDDDDGSDDEINASLETEEERVKRKAAEMSATVVSPAEDIRRRMKRDGFKILSLTEQQWSLLDQSLNPQKYEWLREQEEAERLKAKERAKFLRQSGKKGGKSGHGGEDDGEVDEMAADFADPFGMNSPLLAPFRMTQVEILHIIKCPYIMLSRREIGVRKLLARYHDDTELARRGAAAGTTGFDPHLAERTRAKHPATWTKEESDWASIDKVLNPKIWVFSASKDPETIFKEKTRMKRVIKRDQRYKEIEDGKISGKEKRDHAAAMASTKSKQSNQKDIIARLVGMDTTFAEDLIDEIGGTADNFNLSKFVSFAHKKAGESEGKWECKWTKEQIMRLWATPRRLLKTEEEKHAFKLLMKYSGTYKSYMEALRSWNNKKAESFRGLIDYAAHGLNAPRDLDLRARKVLREIDRVAVSKNAIVTSDALHAMDQRFPRDELLPQWERELDRLLAEQITTTEMARRKRVDSSDSEGGELGSQDSGGASDEVELEEEGIDGDVNRMKKAILKRAKRKARRETKKKQREEVEKRWRKRNKTKKQTSGTALAEALLELELGKGGCIACRSNPCKWRPTVDMDACTHRVEEIEAETRRIKNIMDSDIIESTVCLMAQLGGTSVFSKPEVLWDLERERRAMKNEMDLNMIDKELHDAYATRKEYIEVHHLHGYGVMLWTNNARSALQARQATLVAVTVVKEVVDDILDFMLEGWHFGERESAFTMIGYVPSVKPGGPGERIRAGQDQIRLIGPAMEKIRARAEAKKQGIVLDQFRRGNNAEKAAGIELSAQFALEKANIVKDFDDNAHLLTETENTLRFGLFMMTMMYFRVMALLRREKSSWNGEDELGGKNKKGNKGGPVATVTRERLRMIEEERNTKARLARMEICMLKYRVGTKIRHDREEAFRKQAIKERQALMKQKKREEEAIRLIQRCHRGYHGRINVKRWAVKRAEWDAMKVIMDEAALNIQRVFRGYLGRQYYTILRTEIAQFIAIIRFQEADADEEEYWREHPWSRFKRDQIAWMRKDLTIYKMFVARNAEDYGAPSIGL